VTAVNPLDISAVRARFPALARTHEGVPVAYLDGPGGSQVVDTAITEMNRYLAGGVANLHGAFATSEETDRLLLEARSGAAALLGARADEVAFGQNMTSLAFAVASALGPSWRPADNIVVTELDHRANVDPWLRAAGLAGAQTRWLPVDIERVTLDLSRLDELITPRTRLVALGRASNAVGTITDIRPIADMAHARGALVVVDAVHAVPHLVTDRVALGADVLFCSAYKFFGPHLGMAAIGQGAWDRLDVAKVAPSPATAPDKLETGTQNHEGLAGLLGALEFIGSLGTGDDPRARLTSGMELIRAHEDHLGREFRRALGGVPGLRLYAPPEDVAATPTFSFTIAGNSPRAIAAHLARHGVFVGDGNFYASTLDERLGTSGTGGWTRVGLAPYTTADELARCLAALHDLADMPPREQQAMSRVVQTAERRH
jgi:cysteine desulfurase family protein (TIGR01976 family)